LKIPIICVALKIFPKEKKSKKLTSNKKSSQKLEKKIQKNSHLIFQFVLKNLCRKFLEICWIFFSSFWEVFFICEQFVRFFSFFEIIVIIIIFEKLNFVSKKFYQKIHASQIFEKKRKIFQKVFHTKC